MSPFKVIRCRYFTEDGKAIPPYCNARRHCTFLHPGDKGWPGGEPVPEADKRADDRAPVSRSRVAKNSTREFSLLSRGDIPTSRSMLDTISEDSSTRKNGSYTSKDSPVNSIVKAFHEIAKFQTKLTEDRMELDKAVAKLTAFRELSDTLKGVSAASAAAVAPTLEVVVKNRNELADKLENDAAQLSKLWDGVFNVFLRAICRQFDSELESGTDYLRQEARILLKSFPKHTSSPHHFDDTALAKPHSYHPFELQTLDDSDTHVGKSSPSRSLNTGGMIAGSMTSGEEDHRVAVNPPVGISDNGWARKRRRTSGDNGLDSDEMPPTSVNDIIAKMQQQLEEQNCKIELLRKQNQELECIVQRPSTITLTDTHVSDSDATSQVTSPGTPVPEDQLSSIRQIVRSDVLALLKPAFEEQKKVNDHWESRLEVVAAEIKTMRLMEARATLEEDVCMEPPQPTQSAFSFNMPGKKEDE